MIVKTWSVDDVKYATMQVRRENVFWWPTVRSESVTTQRQESQDAQDVNVTGGRREKSRCYSGQDTARKRKRKDSVQCGAVRRQSL
jgi:hypothetical protein